MSALAIRGNSNYNFQQAQEDPVQEKPVRNRPKTIHVLPHHYFGSLNIPGMFNLFYAPSDLKASINDQFEACKFGDTEGMTDNWLRILEMPFNVSSSSLSNMSFVLQILSYFKVNPEHLALMAKIGRTAPILGLIVCAFESILEILGLTHVSSMLKLLDLPKSFEKLQDKPEELDQAILHSLKRLNREYCETDPFRLLSIEKAVKKKFPQLSRQERAIKIRKYELLDCGARDRNLLRRVYPRCAQKVHELVPQLLEEHARMKPEDLPAWRTRACELLTDVKTQCCKKRLMHIVGLLAVIITIAGLIASLCVCPFAVPLVLLIVGGVLSTVRMGISDGMMHTQGYKFDVYNLIPDYIKAIYRKIFARCIHNKAAQAVCSSA